MPARGESPRWHGVKATPSCFLRSLRGLCTNTMTSIPAKRSEYNVNPGGEPDVLTDQSARRLLAAIARGDESAMAAFYRGHEKNIYSFACSRLRDPQSAADIVNEVMLVVWQTAGSFRGRSQVCTWLLGIANNKVLDALRRQGARCYRELDRQIPDTNRKTGERIVADAQHRRSVSTCLKSLPDAQRQVVHLAFFEDLPYGEIAQILDCPAGTVKTRMYHAKIALKQCLECKGVDGDDL